MKSMQTGKNPVWLLCKVSLCWVSSACFCRRKRTCFWSFTLVFDWQHVNSFTISLSLSHAPNNGKKNAGLFSQICCIFSGVKNLTDWQKRSHFRCSDCSDCSDLVHLAFCSWAGQTRLNFTMCRLASTGFNTGSSPVKSSPSTKNLSESARILKFSRNKENKRDTVDWPTQIYSTNLGESHLVVPAACFTLTPFNPCSYWV